MNGLISEKAPYFGNPLNELSSILNLIDAILKGNIWIATGFWIAVGILLMRLVLACYELFTEADRWWERATGVVVFLIAVVETMVILALSLNRG